MRGFSSRQQSQIFSQEFSQTIEVPSRLQQRNHYPAGRISSSNRGILSKLIHRKAEGPRSKDACAFQSSREAEPNRCCPSETSVLFTQFFMRADACTQINAGSQTSPLAATRRQLSLWLLLHSVHALATMFLLSRGLPWPQYFFFCNFNLFIEDCNFNLRATVMLYVSNPRREKKRKSRWRSNRTLVLSYSRTLPFLLLSYGLEWRRPPVRWPTPFCDSLKQRGTYRFP